MPGFYPNYSYPTPMQYPAPQTTPAVQIQNSGFVSVPNEEMARNYPVAPGNSVTFKDETAPYVYTKTMGFSQLDRPIFEKFKLVKETPAEPVQEAQDEVFDIKSVTSTIDDINGEIERIWDEIEDIKNARPKVTTKQAAPKRDRDGGDD